MEGESGCGGWGGAVAAELHLFARRGPGARHVEPGRGQIGQVASIFTSYGNHSI